MTSFRGAALALTLAATPLAAQSNAERMANDQYTRSHDYDLVDQRISVWGFNWDSTSLEGRVATTLLSLRPGLDSIILDAGAKLRIGAVTDAAGKALRSTAHGDTLVVFLAKPVGFRDTVRFTIGYHAKVDNGRGLTFIQPEGLPHRPRQIWSQGEDHNNHFWFPTYDFPNDKLTWSLEATVPKGMTAVSNGRLMADRRNADGTRTMSWRQDKPSASYLVSLIVAPLVKLADTWKGIPVDYYVYHEDSGLGRPLFMVTPDMIDVYSRLTGIKYPWAKYAQTTVADFFGGMENVSATTLVDWLPDSKAYADRPWYRWILIPHELSHQWFGDYVTTVNWANMWLNEGFAEFMPGQYWSTRLGRAAEDDYYLDEYRQFLDIDAQQRMPLAALGSNNIYPKGALVLRMLERYLGPERFWASVHRYLTDHAFGNATTDDLRQAVLAATGEDLSWFWDEWMYQAGYPEFSVTTSYDSAAHVVHLTVKQTQVDSAKADSTGLRFTTPDVFRMPVTIRVGTAAGDVVRRAQLDAREQTIDIPGVMSAPTMVVFDDGNTILKKLVFDQPTAWLATQLTQDPDLWDRAWVIDRLKERKGDTAAVAALAGAATSAEYFLTRRSALEALDSAPAELALPAAARALADTSAQVRTAAATTLGVLGGDRARELLRQAWQRDTSYAVRGSALAGLARLDSAGRQGLIRQGLATSSYRDVISEGAMRAIVQANDTSFIGAIDSLTGQGINASFVLTILGARGSAHALDLVLKHLDDARAPVRRWALIAIENALPPPVATEKLTAVRDRLTHPETKAAVDQSLTRLAKRGKESH
ncbi:MAG TPA: M1 family aminopeptidase [Gemmatimonadales bacterium]|nr:M1 family aminopeptidase [Gemmatimonadales bacterium]